MMWTALRTWWQRRRSVTDIAVDDNLLELHQWNEVFAQEAKAHREGRSWDWSRYSGHHPVDIQREAVRDGHPLPSDAEAKPWRRI